MLATTPLREDQITFCSDADVIDSVKRLESFRLVDSNPVFEVRSQILDVSWSPYSLLSDPRLTDVIRPCSQLMHDWMHGLFSSGVFNILLQRTLDALEDAGIADLYTLLAEYVGPMASAEAYF